MNNETFKTKEKRDVALTVRLPSSVVKKIKHISKKYNYSQSEVVETLLGIGWQKIDNDENIKKRKHEK